MRNDKRPSAAATEPGVGKEPTTCSERRACRRAAYLPSISVPAVGLLAERQRGPRNLRRRCATLCVLACFAAARATALAQDAINISCVGALESETNVLEGRACVEATLCHAEAPQGIRSGGRVGLEEPLRRFVSAHADRAWLLVAVPRQPLQKLLLVEGISTSAAARFQAR